MEDLFNTHKRWTKVQLSMTQDVPNQKIGGNLTRFSNRYRLDNCARVLLRTKLYKYRIRIGVR